MQSGLGNEGGGTPRPATFVSLPTMSECSPGGSTTGSSAASTGNTLTGSAAPPVSGHAQSCTSSHHTWATASPVPKGERCDSQDDTLADVTDICSSGNDSDTFTTDEDGKNERNHSLSTDGSSISDGELTDIESRSYSRDTRTTGAVSKTGISYTKPRIVKDSTYLTDSTVSCISNDTTSASGSYDTTTAGSTFYTTSEGTLDTSASTCSTSSTIESDTYSDSDGSTSSDESSSTGENSSTNFSGESEGSDGTENTNITPSSDVSNSSDNSQSKCSHGTLTERARVHVKSKRKLRVRSQTDSQGTSGSVSRSQSVASSYGRSRVSFKSNGRQRATTLSLGRSSNSSRETLNTSHGKSTGILRGRSTTASSRKSNFSNRITISRETNTSAAFERSASEKSSGQGQFSQAVSNLNRRIRPLKTAQRKGAIGSKENSTGDNKRNIKTSSGKSSGGTSGSGQASPSLSEDSEDTSHKGETEEEDGDSEEENVHEGEKEETETGSDDDEQEDGVSTNRTVQSTPCQFSKSTAAHESQTSLGDSISNEEDSGSQHNSDSVIGTDTYIGKQSDITNRSESDTNEGVNENDDNCTKRGVSSDASSGDLGNSSVSEGGSSTDTDTDNSYTTDTEDHTATYQEQVSPRGSSHITEVTSPQSPMFTCEVTRAESEIPPTPNEDLREPTPILLVQSSEQADTPRAIPKKRKSKYTNVKSRYAESAYNRRSAKQGRPYRSRIPPVGHPQMTIVKISASKAMVKASRHHVDRMCHCRHQKLLPHQM